MGPGAGGLQAAVAGTAGRCATGAEDLSNARIGTGAAWRRHCTDRCPAASGTVGALAPRIP
jgi:hypothetical protein